MYPPKSNTKVIALAIFATAVVAAAFLFFMSIQSEPEKSQSQASKQQGGEQAAAQNPAAPKAQSMPPAPTSAQPAVAAGQPAAAPLAQRAAPPVGKSQPLFVTTSKGIAATNLTTDPPRGELTGAIVSTAGQQFKPILDQAGNFQRVYIQPKEKVPVALTFPDGQPGDKVAIRVEDGGALDEGAPGKVYEMDANKAVNFTFQANADDGIYHVVATNGSSTRVLNFWVGPEPPMANR